MAKWGIWVAVSTRFPPGRAVARSLFGVQGCIGVLVVLVVRSIWGVDWCLAVLYFCVLWLLLLLLVLLVLLPCRYCSTCTIRYRYDRAIHYVCM